MAGQEVDSIATLGCEENKEQGTKEGREKKDERRGKIGVPRRGQNRPFLVSTW